MSFRRRFFRYFFYSIFTRVILVGLIIVLGGSAIRLYVFTRVLAPEIMAASYRQQQAFAQDLADFVDQKQEMRQAFLEKLGQALSPALLNDPQALQVWLHQINSLWSPFPGGLIVEDGDGTVIARDPISLSWSSIDGIAQTRPVLFRGGAEVGQLNRGIGVATGVLLPRGGEKKSALLRGLVGETGLGYAEFLKDHPNGKKGGYFLVFPREGLYFDSSFSSQEPRSLPLAGADSLIARALAEDAAQADKMDSTIRRESHGEEIFALATVPASGWRVVAHLPKGEANAFLDHAKSLVLQSLWMGTVISVLLAGLGLFVTLRPLARASDLANRMRRGEAPLMPLPWGYRDEIGDLIGAFNRLLQMLKEQQQAVTAQKEIAEKATLAKSSFLAAASHDLRQPLHALNLYLGSMDDLTLPADQLRKLENARLCAQTMDEMFRALLDISCLDAGTLRREKQVIAMADLLEQIRCEFQPQADIKGLKLRVVPCSLKVWSDPASLERILRNFVSNAIRYTGDGSVLVGCRRQGAELLVSVYDTGCGIEPGKQRMIFEDFYRVGASGQEGHRDVGFGLGLAIVQRLASLLQTPLSLVSEPGRGSVFSILLPCCEGAPSSKVERLSFPGKLSVASDSLSGVLVVVIDDDASIRNAMQSLLEHWGCDVVAAPSGLSAVAHLGHSQQRPRAILCDYRLRAGETGPDAIRTLRDEFNHDIPALLVTGETAPDQIREIQQSGFPVLHKPLQDRHLKEALLLLLA